MAEINGLPVAVLAVLCAVGVVILGWLVMRYAAKILTGLVVVGGIIAVLMLAAAPLANEAADVAESGAEVAEAAATFEQAVAVAEVAQVAQSGSNETVMLVGLFGCMGGGAIFGVLALAGAGLFVWYKVRTDEQQRQVQRGQYLPQPPPQPQIQAGDFDLSWIDNDDWVEQGERAWQQNDALYW